ncbi:protein kinase dsk1 [Achaetomium macrosporum]|uniref:non-specific serine/threonine protein kinase n=1 Tax=Achaetomium macrosporum TaxID=79813 RepID=A0AAN7C2B1_9PEZI|nr:protein kinase dsk1 [Achaetomium macrosporum]
MVYHPGSDVEDLENYKVSGYHPTVIGETFRDGRYKVVHKLGCGSYSTSWLARDEHLERYVALKILVASETSKSQEPVILRLLHDSGSTHQGNQFIPRLLDDFELDGPNGRHLCLVQEAATCTIGQAKEDSRNWMFPVEVARSIAAQLILGLSYMHSRGVCHGDLHMRNFLIYNSNLGHLSPEELYTRYPLHQNPVTRTDGQAPEPHAPPQAVVPMWIKTRGDELVDPIVKISDYGTSFVATNRKPAPTLQTPALYLPPEGFFDESATPAADVWSLGVNLYEVLGERPLFETFAWAPDDILAEMVSTLGPMPQRWLDEWAKRSNVFNDDGKGRRGAYRRFAPPVFRRLHQRMWDMGCGETPETCQWDVEGGEMRAVEEMLRGMLAYEPDQRLTAEELLESEYMLRWALPAWERQKRRQEGIGVMRPDNPHACMDYRRDSVVCSS